MNGPDDLFAASGHAPAASGALARAAPASLLLHGLALTAVLVPLWNVTSPPDEPQRSRQGVVIWDPPAPPPAPLPVGEPDGRRAPVVTQRERATSAVVEPAPAETVTEPAAPVDVPADDAPAGSPNGDATGVEDGSELGRRGGVVGGVPDGTIGGVVGGTGDGLVARPDVPPRLLRRVEPVYPPEAFAKKIQGTVEVEIVIDAAGHVAHTRVVRGVPQLDAAAENAVRQWLFSPALKDGRAVATRAMAPVKFTIY